MGIWSASRGPCGARDLVWRHGTGTAGSCGAPPALALSASGRFRIVDATDARFVRWLGYRLDAGPASGAGHLALLLGRLDELFAGSGVVSWAWGETLLGSVRDGDLLPWQEEAELVVRGEDRDRVLSLGDAARRSGLLLVAGRETALEDAIVFRGAGSTRSVRVVFAPRAARHASGPVVLRWTGGASRAPVEVLPEEIFPLRRRRVGSAEVNVPGRAAEVLVRACGRDGLQTGLVACRCQSAAGRYLLEVRREPAVPVEDASAPTRILTEAESAAAPRIDRRHVELFFAGRAAKIGEITPMTAVIYQDKNPDLAIRRDAAERELLLPMIGAGPGVRVLDVGCGTGRWTAAITDTGADYHGIDGCEGFVEHARALHAGRPKARFSVCAADRLDLAAIGESEGFDRILCLGLLIYLNDEEVARTLRALAAVASLRARVVIREPVGIGRRLTIRDHYSADMDQMYNAVYRTEAELLAMAREELGTRGFRLVGSGDVYADASLNNRAETRQRWLVLER